MAKDKEEKALAEEMAHSLRNYEPDESVFGAPRAQSGYNILQNIFIIKISKILLSEFYNIPIILKYS